MCSFNLFLFSVAWYCHCFHLFLGSREAYIDRARCFKCFKLGHWARDCTSAWSSARNVYRGTGLAPATLTAPTSPARECNPTPVLDSEVFEEEVSDIAQVHCENDLFELELTDHPPLGNVKGNLRRKLEVWKRIGTSKFILNVIERGHMLPFRNQLYLETINHPLPLQNLSRMLYVNYLSRVVLLKLRTSIDG